MSFDCGTYVALVFVSSLISTNELWEELKAYIESRFFNLLEMGDLEYILKGVNFER